MGYCIERKKNGDWIKGNKGLLNENEGGKRIIESIDRKDY